jgi:SNF2 family DNA or RNA helicase
MSTAPALAGFTPARELPNGEPFCTEFGLFPFQAEGLLQAYDQTSQGDGGALLVFDLGIGKTMIAIAFAAFLFDSGEIDQVVVLCEKNKRYDWRDEIAQYSVLSSLLYHGTGRQKRLERNGVPHALVTTYETARIELMSREKAPGKRGRGTAVDGPLMTRLGLRSKRVLWILDEPTKIKNRGSENHRAINYVMRQMRAGPHHHRMLGLTGTPVESNYSDGYNLGRVFFPSLMPTVADFERIFCTGRDNYGNLQFNASMKDSFAEVFRRGIIRKRKTDPDVIDQFPQLIEKSVKVEMNIDQADFYEVVSSLFDPPEDGEDTRTEAEHVMDDRKMWTLCRMTAGHPASHIHASNDTSRMIVELVGEEGLRAISSAKSARLIEDIRPLVKGQGAQVLLFSFFTSVIIEVARELREAGFIVAEHHGKRSDAQNEKAKADFASGEVEILFSSDIGAKGLNMPHAQYVIEYESALTYSNRSQRMGRIHRIVSTYPSVTGTTMVLTGTVEEDIFAKTIDRNADQDLLLGDMSDGTAFVSAQERRDMLAAHRRRKR